MDFDAPYRRDVPDGLLRLDANEGPAPRPELLALLAAAGPELLCRYPDRGPLTAQIARHHGLAPDRVLVTCGGDEAIDRAMRVFAGPRRAIALHVPAFSMTLRYAVGSHSELVQVPWERGEFPSSALRAAAEAAALVVLTTPNNPTGCTIPTPQLLELVDVLAPRVVLVDLAYVEFAAKDPTAALLEREHVLVVRTFSKAHGLAGLRVGYVLGSAAHVRRLEAQGSPFPVSGLSLCIAERAHALGPDVDYVQRVRSERRLLAAALSSCGLEVYDSEANFVFGRGDRAAAVHEGLRARGIATRWLAPPGGVRITCPGAPRAFAALTNALRDVAQQRDTERGGTC